MWHTTTDLPAKLAFQPRAVCLVGCDRHFCAVSRQSPVSTQPFTYMVSLSKQSTTAKTILEQQEYSINFLANAYLEQIDYSGRVFGADEDKWSKTGFSERAPQVIQTPLIEQAFAAFECTVFEAKEVHDHYAFFGEAVAFHWRDDVEYPDGVDLPLYLGRGYYARHAAPQRFRSSLLPPR